MIHSTEGFQSEERIMKEINMPSDKHKAWSDFSCGEMIDLVVSNEPDSELSSMLDQASHKDLRASLLMISPS